MCQVFGPGDAVEFVQNQLKVLFVSVICISKCIRFLSPLLHLTAIIYCSESIYDQITLAHKI